MKRQAIISLLTVLALNQVSTPLFVNAQEQEHYYSQSVVISNGKTIDQLIEPVMGPHGYFVDVFHSNRTENQSPTTNAVVGVLSEFLELFTPGVDTSEGANDRWKTGTVINQEAHLENLELTNEIVMNATDEEKDNSYLVDRRNQNYSSIFGLGKLATEFMEGVQADTTIPDEIPADANEVTYDEEATWAQSDSEYGAIVDLVGVVRGGSASTNPSKEFYQYPRPYRWNGIDENMPVVEVVDSLIPRKKPEEEASNDGGFPSGHTNASYLASLSMAYAVPEQYHSLLLNASELGNSRIVAGMHSIFDVVGGRMSSSAITTANLNVPENEEAKANAFADGRKLLENANQPVDADIYDENPELYEEHRQLYLDRLTYNLTPDEATDENATVPKGAEVLLETRFPYLDATERRFILLTTAISSGHPVANDAEGFGRLNLFDAVSGYGSFVKETVVNLDADAEGFMAKDTYRNNIDGSGSLVKQGTGTLVLTGDNTYSGSTTIEDGMLVAKSSTALGTGHVVNNGQLEVDSEAGLTITGSLTQTEDAELTLIVDSLDDVLSISKSIDGLAGTIRITLAEGFEATEAFTVIQLPAEFDASNFDVVVDSDGFELVQSESGFDLQVAE